jgi:hypothetical protein
MNELTVEPEMYCPSINETGNYIDKIPPLIRGIRCPCGTRKNKVYDTHSIFSSHIKTKTHNEWLLNLNLNKANYFIQTEELKKTVHNQRIIIAKLEKELKNKHITIDYLTNQLVLNTTTDTQINLLDI